MGRGRGVCITIGLQVYRCRCGFADRRLTLVIYWIEACSVDKGAATVKNEAGSDTEVGGYPSPAASPVKRGRGKGAKTYTDEDVEADYDGDMGVGDNGDAEDSS